MTNQVPWMKNPTQGLRERGFNSYKFSSGFPTRENCDLNSPREAFLWQLVALPGVNGAQLVTPISYNMVISEHLWECGSRVVCENCGHSAEPQKKYVAPKATEPHWMTSPGKWVDPKTPTPTPHPADVVLEKATLQQKAELFARLKKMHESGQF